MSEIWQDAGLTHELIEQLNKKVQQCLNDPIYWFPIRHHSPRSAFLLQKAILERKPKQVFIEAPSHCMDLLPFIVDTETKPPIAIYSSFIDSENTTGLAGIQTPSPEIMASIGSWLPLLAYSPEFVAMKAADKIGSEIIFIDLPCHVRLSFSRGESPADHETDQILASRFYQLLVNAGQYHSWNECWDSIFEAQSNIDDFRYQLACFCAAVRQTVAIDEETLQREHHMWQQIQTNMNSPDEAMVVCGGLHVFMAQHKDNDITATKTVFGDEYHTLVPYTFHRVSEQSGYQAGNRAPYFYQQVWNALKSDLSDHERLYQHIQYLIQFARKKGEPLSAADALACSQHALMLCQLRNRTQPILDDMLDAIISCCCKGDPDHEGRALLLALQAALIGSKRGGVSTKVGQLPLVKDFNEQLEIHQVQRDSEYRFRVKLDKRKQTDQQASAFFHRLSFLKIPFAEFRDSDHDHGMIFKEQWSCQYDIGVEERLIELSAFGDTLQSVAVNQLERALSEPAISMAKLSDVLLYSVDMGLPQVMTKAQLLCQQVLVDDHQFISLAQGFANLLRFRQQLAFIDYSFSAIEPMIELCFSRACQALLSVASAPKEEEPVIVHGLLQLSQAYLSSEIPSLDRDCFIDYLQQAADVSPVPFIRGCFLGALLEIKHRPPEYLAEEVASFRFADAETMIDCSLFIEGVMAVSKTSILLG